MEKAKLMQLEIEEKRKLPKNVKEEIILKIFHTLIVAIIIVLYFLTVNWFYYNLESVDFEYCMKYYALGIIIATVIVFEIGYRKNSLKYIYRTFSLWYFITIYSIYIFAYDTIT